MSRFPLIVSLAISLAVVSVQGGQTWQVLRIANFQVLGAPPAHDSSIQ